MGGKKVPNILRDFQNISFPNLTLIDISDNKIETIESLSKLNAENL